MYIYVFFTNKSIHLPHPPERSPWKVQRNENIATQKCLFFLDLFIK